VQVSGGIFWKSLTAGTDHTCGVTADGSAYCWGSNQSGQIGVGSTGGVMATPAAVSGGRRWGAISAGPSETCGVTLDGSGQCWGANPSGGLGNGSWNASAEPATVATTNSWSSLTVGSGHACGRTVNGFGYCWGLNDVGQVGDGTNGTANNRSIPSFISVKIAGILATSTPAYARTATVTATMGFFASATPVSTGTAVIAATVAASPTVNSTPGAGGRTRFVTVANVRDSAFTVSWTTDNAVTGSIRWVAGTATPTTTANDVRGAATTSTVHVVTVRNLLPSTKYSFDIVSGNATDTNSGAHFAVTTGPTLNLGSPDTIVGVAQAGASGSASDAYVVVSAQSTTGVPSAPIAALIPARDAGSWTLSLGDLRTQDRQSVFSVTSTTVLNVDVYAGSGGMARGTVTVADARIGSQVLTLAPTVAATINLIAGWNLVAAPVMPETDLTAPAVCTALNTTGGAGTAVEIDQYVDGGWIGHRCGIPPNGFSLVPGKGYFVRVQKPVVWTVYGTPPDGRMTHEMQAGWNLIAFPGMTGRYDAPGVLGSLNLIAGAPAGVVVATEIDRWQDAGWEGNRPDVPVNKFAIEDGRGYFVKLTAPLTWAVPGTLAMNRVRAGVLDDAATIVTTVMQETGSVISP
jgi:hypothetical protein